MKTPFSKSRKGPVIYTDPCPTSPVSKAIDVIQSLAIVAAIIISVTRR